MSKKYQVFISSTYEDLIIERKAVEETVIRAGDFPVGMEAFPAADDEQFEFIKTLIDLCDYYVLIVGGRYGSLADDGLSYTEKEYRYATSREIPVLFMLHGDRGSLSATKTEKSDDGKEKLAAFIELASDKRIRKEWLTTDALKLAVREALDYAKATKPRPGWVRGDSVASRQTLARLANARRENDALKVRLGDLNTHIELPELPSIDAEIFLEFNSSRQEYGTAKNVRIKSTFKKMTAPFLSSVSEKNSGGWSDEEFYWIDIDEVREKFSLRIAADKGSNWQLSEESFHLLHSYFIEAGVLTEGGEKRVLDDAGRKYVRRLSVTNSGQSPDFEVVSGEFLDPDEIPF